MKENKINRKKVSVILPVYNGEQYLEEALESILSQTYTNIELVIVDDCSTDRTEEIITKYSESDRRIRYIRNAVNLKLPRTLNVGFANAEGDYLTWTSDDNRYKPEALERMVYWIESKPDIDMVYADYTGIDSGGKITCEKEMGEPSELPFHNVVGACFLYKREVAQKAGEYDPDLFLAEDYDYWIRIKRAGRLMHIHENLYYYREHGKSLTLSKREQVLKQTYRVAEKHFLYFYSQMQNRRDRIRFLETLEDRTVKPNRRQVQRQIYCIYPAYRWHIFCRGVKYRINMAIHIIKEKLI
ncbi:MAG: glycosyltransferase [Ruminococcus flavefaciens]|nr:glycosyltransferase [Ruminococcus flavefaciens]